MRNREGLLKCPCCGKFFEHTCEDGLPDTVYIWVRHKKIGFTGTISPGMLRYFESGQGLYRTLNGVLDVCCMVGEDAIYECKQLGSRQELREARKRKQKEEERDAFEEVTTA